MPKQKNKIIDINPVREVLFEKFNQNVAVCNFIIWKLDGCRIRKSFSSVFFIKKYTIWFELDNGQLFMNQKVFTIEFERLFPGIIDNVIKNERFSDTLKNTILKKYNIEYNENFIDIGDWQFDLYERTRAGLVPNKNLIKF